jgi:hypothetical protein
MTAGKKWQFLCVQHGESLKKCCTIDYVSPNVETTIKLLLNPLFFPDRFEINDHVAKVFPKMIKYLYRTLVYIFFHQTNLFNTSKEKFKICQRLTLYCKKFKIMQSKEFII